MSRRRRAAIRLLRNDPNQGPSDRGPTFYSVPAVTGMNETSFSDYMRALAAAMVLAFCCAAPVAVASGRISVLRLFTIIGAAAAIGLVAYGLVRWRARAR